MASTDATALIASHGLRFRYGASAAADLHFPDFELPRGAHLLLRGASGSGKSTLLALMAGLLTPTAGRLAMDGVEVGALAPAARDAWRGAHLGFVPQRLHLSVQRCAQLGISCLLLHLALKAESSLQPQEGFDLRAFLCAEVFHNRRQ